MDPLSYTAGDQFQRERQTLFAREWLLFAVSGQMPAPGNFVSHGLGGWPLVAVRGEDGVARAFHNICRHQNMPVVNEPDGKCEILRCRYHGWAYRTDGSFYDAPTRLAPSGPPEQFALNPAELVEQNGFCLVRIRAGDAAAPALALAGEAYAASITTDIDANWKAVIEPHLDDTVWRLVWPLALIAAEDTRTIVRQIVPRSFLRTRIVDLVFTPDGALPDSLEAALRQRAISAKTVTETRQAQHAAGTAPTPSPAVTKFRQQIAAACAA